MCNKLHKNYKKIPETGIGYKIFHRKEKTFDSAYKLDSFDIKLNQTLKWNKSFGDKLDHGFCFFLTKQQAKRLLRILRNEYRLYIQKNRINLVLCKIEYRNGLGKFKNYNYPYYLISLCQSFKIVEIVHE